MRQIAGKHAIHARPLQHRVLQAAFVPFQRELPFPREQHVPDERVVPPSPHRSIARELVGQKPRSALRGHAAKTLNDRNRGYSQQDRRRLHELRQLRRLRRLRRLRGLGGADSPGQIAEEFLERLGSAQSEQLGREVAEQSEEEEQWKRGISADEHLVEALHGQRRGPAGVFTQQLGMEESAEEPRGRNPSYTQKTIKTRTLDRDRHVEGVRKPGRSLIKTRSPRNTVMKSSFFSIS